MWTNIRFVLWCFVLWASLDCQVASAQAWYTRFEAGQTLSVLPNSRLGTATEVGLGGRIVYNLSPNFALESEASVYLNKPDLTATQFGGRALLVLSGVKAGTHRKRIGIFLKARPGLMSFSQAAGQRVGEAERRTHFVADLGAVLELYPTRRSVVRFDVGGLLVRYKDRVLSSTPTTLVFSVGRIDSLAYLAAGINYRLGSTREEHQSARASSGFTLGMHYTLMSLERSVVRVRDESGFGGHFSFDINRYLALDGGITFFPPNHNVIEFQEGGRILQGLVGLRAGIRRERFGVFAKLRPGFQSYGRTIGDLQDSCGRHFSRFTNFASDIGVVFEVYYSRRTVLRFDVGSTNIRFRRRKVTLPDGSREIAAPFNGSAIQIGTGIGWRF